MIKTSFSSDGSCLAYTTAEITAVPYYELINKDTEQASVHMQSFFTRLLSQLFRIADNESSSFEIIFLSRPVSDQTYMAQVRMFFVIRHIANNSEIAVKKVNELADAFRVDMESCNYFIDFFEDESAYERFFTLLKEVKNDEIAAVSKREKGIPFSFSDSGLLYFNPVITPSENLNITILTNIMTQYPDSAVSLQIIPTAYSDAERVFVSQARAMLGYYAGELRRMQGMMAIDSATNDILISFDHYCAAANEKNAYINFTVHAPRGCSNAIAGKLISVIENENASRSNAFEIVDIQRRYLLSDNFPIAPWQISNMLLYEERADFWNSGNAPELQRRMKYLLTEKELRGIFRFPYDDGCTIGLESRKIRINHEKLNAGILSEGNFKIGVICNASANSSVKTAHAGIPLNDFTKHGLIVGTPGSGKTNFSLGFLIKMWDDFHIPFIAIEPTKSEYRSIVDHIHDLQIFTPGKSNVSPYIINPFIPPTGVTVETYVPSLMTAFRAAFSMPDPLPNIFLASVNECYNEYGWKLSSTKDDPGIEFFGMYEFIKVFRKRIQSMDYKGDVKANMESAGVVRLVSLIEQNSMIYDSINTIPIEDILRKPTVIELNAINNKEQKSLIMALLLIMICVYTKNNISGDGKLKNILLIDEAHVLLSASGSSHSDNSADAQGSTIEAIEDMIAEIRSYGTGIIIADQSPSKVGKNIVANTNIKIIFRLVEKENKDMIRNAVNMNDADYERLGRLDVGEAMVHYSRVYEPLHIKTYALNEIADIRPVVGDAEIAALSHYWDDKQYLLIPHAECRYNCSCRDKCDFSVRSDADYIAARLLNQYRTEITSLSLLAKKLVNLDKPINDIINSTHGAEYSIRLSNCIKIKFLRKILIEKGINVNRENYRRILEHKNFLKGE